MFEDTARVCPYLQRGRCQLQARHGDDCFCGQGDWAAAIPDRSAARPAEEPVATRLVPDITPETHPDHHTVGQRFRAYNSKYDKPDTFYCESHDASGYNMQSETTDHRTNVSERAIGRTFHQIYY